MKKPINRKEAIKLIKSYASDEYETLNDLWELAEKTDFEITEILHNILEYYKNAGQDR